MFKKLLLSKNFTWNQIRVFQKQSEIFVRTFSGVRKRFVVYGIGSLSILGEQIHSQGFR